MLSIDITPMNPNGHNKLTIFLRKVPGFIKEEISDAVIICQFRTLLQFRLQGNSKV